MTKMVKRSSQSFLFKEGPGFMMIIQFVLFVGLATFFQMVLPSWTFEPVSKVKRQAVVLAGPNGSSDCAGIGGFSKDVQDLFNRGKTEL